MTGSWMYPCTMKDTTSIINPMIVLDTHTADGENINPLRWNYCYIPDFRRYYFITNIVADHNLWNIFLQVDVLASFKHEIEQAEVYVLRSSKFRDEFIVDGILPTKAQIKNVSYPADWTYNEISSNSSGGCYIVGVLNNESNNKAVTYYAMTNVQFNELKQSLFALSNFRNTNTMEISDDLLKVLYNPFQYIASVVYLPVSVDKISDQSNTTIVSFGWWDNPAIYATGRKITRDISAACNWGTITFEKHEKAGMLDTQVSGADYGVEPFDGRGQYLNYAPYSHYYVYADPFGFFELDNNVIGTWLSSEAVDEASVLTLKLEMLIDPITGKGYLRFVPTDERLQDEWQLLPWKTAMVGVPIQIGQITADVMGGALVAAQGISDAANQASFFNPVGSAIGGIVSTMSGIYDGLKTAAPRLQTSGTQGGFATYSFDVYSLASYQIPTEAAPEETGYPLMRTVELNECKPGFVKTLFTDIEIANALDDERTKIVKLLNEGVHLELDEGDEE